MTDTTNPQAEPVHGCPPDGSGLTPCCGRTPFELPPTDRMSVDPALVTCQPAVPVPVSAPTDWIDGHPQLEAIAAAVWARCEHHDSGATFDDPRNIAVAALAALAALAVALPAPTDRAAILQQEADRIRAHCPDHLDSGSAPGAWMVCHCDVADDMQRRRADVVPVSGPGGAADETQAVEPVFAPGMPCEHGCRAAADELTRETQQPETQVPVRVETLARLLCDTDNTLTDGPGWDRISQTPGLGRDEYRNAARYLLRRVSVTQPLDGPQPLLCGDQIPDMTCTLPDGPHDDWKHRDEVGRWWSQMRVPPHSNRDRIAAEDPTP